MKNELVAQLSDDCCLSKKVGIVFSYKAVGKTNPEIAGVLHRSVRTIDTQTTAYLNEIGAKNTQEAVAVAVSEGWLTFKHIVSKVVIFLCISLSVLTFENDKKVVKNQRLARTVLSVRKEAV